MSFENTRGFTKENLDTYLQYLGKEYRRLNGKTMPAEIILVGGAAIVANYGFRDMTTDVDAVIHAVSSMKEAINTVGDKYNLPYGWLNADFTRTSSFSHKLEQYSVYYKQFSNVLNVRIVSGEYLIAMKLRSGRSYKNDLSDIIGILSEHEKRAEPITMDKIDKAVVDLYGSWNEFPKDSMQFIADVMQKGNFNQLFELVRMEENYSKKVLINFEQNNPDMMDSNNVDIILKEIKKEEKKEQILERLKSMKNEPE